MIHIFRTIILIFFAFNHAQAETIQLKSGNTVEGKIIERTAEFIKVDTGSGVPITYYLDGIELVDEGVPHLFSDKELNKFSAFNSKITSVKKGFF